MRIYLMVGEDSTNKGIHIKLRRRGDVCIEDGGWCGQLCQMSQCFDIDNLLSEEEYKGLWVQTKLTSEGHMEVICTLFFWLTSYPFAPEEYRCRDDQCLAFFMLR